MANIFSLPKNVQNLIRILFVPCVTCICRYSAILPCPKEGPSVQGQQSVILPLSSLSPKMAKGSPLKSEVNTVNRTPKSEVFLSILSLLHLVSLPLFDPAAAWQGPFSFSPVIAKDPDRRSRLTQSHSDKKRVASVTSNSSSSSLFPSSNFGSSSSRLLYFVTSPPPYPPLSDCYISKFGW